ncbi:long-chain fatty acid-CoA ligase [Entophlyctis luteolus]|nr:long-chain fatty acid-CoA ligase [Entophlyctis luteolus]
MRPSTPVLRNPQYTTLAVRPADGIDTVFDMFQFSFKSRRAATAIGSRKVLSTSQGTKDGRPWTFFELSPYEWMTWAEIESLSLDIASGLHFLGLRPSDKLTIFADTSKDWMLMAIACISQSIVITTAYATLGQEGLQYSLTECSITAMFTNAELLPMVAKISKSVETLKTVIYNGEASADVLAALRNDLKIKVLSIVDLAALGRESPAAPVPPSAEDLAVIMYTSGTTGAPKGVEITHSNIVAACTGGINYLKKYANESDSYLGYLPLAHILEFAVEIAALFMGIKIGYGSVKTLTDVSVRNCKGDLRELRPTLFAGVPAVWEGIRKAVLGKIQSAGIIGQTIFAIAYYVKLQLMYWGLGFLAMPLDALVFSKIKEQVGGRMKMALSGGAPMPRKTQEFLSVTAVSVVNGYGMTECTAVVALQELQSKLRVGITGTIASSIEMKLVDVDDTEYKSTNKPKPQGEVWVRGPSIMRGYFKQEALTKEVMTEDGWLMTGDIGEVNQDGTITLIDRKKNLVKLSNGEYIALEKLEASYRMSKYIFNLIVHADPEKSYPIAIVMPIEKEIRSLAKSINPQIDADSCDYKELCNRSDIIAVILDSMKEIAKSVNMKPAEIVRHVVLSPEEWMPQNGFLTAAMKVQRRFVIQRYQSDIDAVYV